MESKPAAGDWPSPFGDPHYGEEAEHGPYLIASRPRWTLEENQSALTGWAGALVVVAGAAVLAACRETPALPRFVESLPFAAQRVLLEWAGHLWEFRVLVLIALVFVVMLLVETIVFKVQRRHFDFTAPRPTDAAAWKRIGARWLALAFCAGVAAFLYNVLGEYSFWLAPYPEHGFYAGFELLYGFALAVALVLALPYFWLVERYARPEGPVDEFLVLARCLKRFFRGLFFSSYRADGLSAVKNPHVRNLFRGLLVKFFFVPVMLNFCLVNWKGWEWNSHWLLDHWSTAWSSQNLAATLHLLNNAVLTLMIALDVSIAVVGYVMSFRLLDTHVTTAEPTFFGWAVALACYPPFVDGISGIYLKNNVQEVYPVEMFQNHLLLSIVMTLVMLVLMGIYMWATFSFGMRFSNLTNRGIICCGPYRFVRHPAYISKNLTWWLGLIPWFFMDLPMKGLLLIYVIRLLGSNLIYGLRAYTEERHLLREQHYREYCQKVPWRFIPYVW